MKRRHRAGFWIGLAIMLLSVWPLYPLLAGIEPRVLGMPMSMFWLVLMVAAVFFTFLAVFRADREDDAALDEEYRR